MAETITTHGGIGGMGAGVRDTNFGKKDAQGMALPPNLVITGAFGTGETGPTNSKSTSQGTISATGGMGGDGGSFGEDGGEGENGTGVPAGDGRVVTLGPIAGGRGGLAVNTNGRRFSITGNPVMGAVV